MHEEPVETTLYSLDRAPPKRRHRKRDERHLTLFRVGALTVGGRRELCLIKNISAGGMLIRAYSEIPVGTPLCIELKQGEPISGVARWVENESIGVSFDRPIDVVSLISISSKGPTPRMPRIEVDCAVTVRDGANMVRGRVSNISQGGLRIETSGELAVGAAVIVTLSGLAAEPAVVTWNADDCYGLAFNRVLSVTQLAAWLKTQQQDRSVVG